MGNVILEAICLLVGLVASGGGTLEGLGEHERGRGTGKGGRGLEACSGGIGSCIIVAKVVCELRGGWGRGLGGHGAVPWPRGIWAVGGPCAMWIARYCDSSYGTGTGESAGGGSFISTALAAALKEHSRGNDIVVGSDWICGRGSWDGGDSAGHTTGKV